MPAVRLVLVRHGESEWNAAGILQGHGGPGLTERGRAQAAATARLLARDHGHAVAIVRSDLLRVAETAAPTEEAVDGVPVRIDERLRELDVGRWTGRFREEVARTDARTFAAWAGGDDVPAGGGETFARLRERVVAALDEAVDAAAGAAASDRTVLVFTHGGPIRVAVAAGLGLPVGGHRSVKPVGNCAITVLDVEPSGGLAHGRTLLAAYNRVEHLTAGAPGEGGRPADAQPRQARADTVP